MPITPLHFGPATVAKALAPKHFSFFVFGLTQLAMDAEPAFYLAQGVWPVHRFFHTYLGATVVAVVAGAAGRPLAGLLARLWNRRLAPAQRKWLWVDPRIPLTAAVSGALFGAYSHVFLDSIIHTDLRPLAPWSDRNGLLNLVSVGLLNLSCAGLALLGGILLLRLILRRKRQVRA